MVQVQSSVSIVGIVVLLLAGLIVLAVIIGGAVAAFSISRRSKADPAAEANVYLSAENQRLREEIARLKAGGNG